MRFLSLAVAVVLSLLATGRAIGAPGAHPIAQDPSALLDGEVMAVCYSGFRAGQHPDRGEGAKNPSDSEILEDLRILLRDTPFRLIRLYDSGVNSEAVLRLIDEHDLPIRVMLGAWLAAEVSNPGCPWMPEPYPAETLEANRAGNAREVARAIRLANAYPGIVASVAVGNEALVGWTDHMVPVETVIGYVRAVKDAIDQPVTVADNYDWWARHGQELARELDFVSVHIYPVWEDRGIDAGLSYGIENMQRVRDTLPDARLVITEAGWATTASEFGPRASEANQLRYYRELAEWAREMNITTFFFEAFDESWKGDPNNPIGAEKHWGLYFEDRTPKLAIRAMTDGNASDGATIPEPLDPGSREDRVPEMIENLVTSEAGHRLDSLDAVAFGIAPEDTPAGRPVIRVFPEDRRQVIEGIGSSFTESSAFVLAHLDPARRRAVMESIFGADGADFALTRTHIGACDFSVEGKYSYADTPGDDALVDFTIAPDLAGFDPSVYPGIKDPSYDLLPMILEAQAIKRAQGDELRIIASAWTAPAWMKDTGEWFIPGSPANDWQGTGGSLMDEHYGTYAEYLVKYLEAYEDAGVDIWGLTPVNEPNGNGGHWESMHFSPETQNRFVRDNLGPGLREGGHDDVRLLVYDQNRDDLEHWTDVMFADPVTSSYVFGVAVHWYASTVKVFEDAFDRIHDAYPGFAIIHTEGCIDNLGNPAPGGIEDPDGFEEENWFGNDAFWWNRTATDWAYSATWAGPGAADHPMYTPVHRYARNIIVSLDHWVGGWVDWNVVLDREGGPNHANNFCGAPIMIDTATGEVYETPIFHVLSQFSRTIRPGDHAVRTEQGRGGLGSDDLHACATINGEGVVSVQVLNTTKAPIAYTLRIGSHEAEVTIPANAVQTLRVRR